MRVDGERLVDRTARVARRGRDAGARGRARPASPLDAVLEDAAGVGSARGGGGGRRRARCPRRRRARTCWWSRSTCRSSTRRCCACLAERRSRPTQWCRGSTAGAQPLCARYSPAALRPGAPMLVAAGERSMQALLGELDGALGRRARVGRRSTVGAVLRRRRHARRRAADRAWRAPGSLAACTSPRRVAPRRPSASGSSTATIVRDQPDRLVTEEPMEIRVESPGRTPEPLTVTMRTPGPRLRAGGRVLRERARRRRRPTTWRPSPTACGATVPRSTTSSRSRTRTAVDLEPHRRAFVSNASCGLCGKTTLDQVEAACAPVASDLRVTAAALDGDAGGAARGAGRVRRDRRRPRDRLLHAPTARSGWCARTSAATTRSTR